MVQCALCKTSQRFIDHVNKATRWSPIDRNGLTVQGLDLQLSGSFYNLPCCFQGLCQGDETASELFISLPGISGFQLHCILRPTVPISSCSTGGGYNRTLNKKYPVMQSCTFIWVPVYKHLVGVSCDISTSSFS